MYSIAIEDDPEDVEDEDPLPIPLSSDNTTIIVFDLETTSLGELAFSYVFAFIINSYMKSKLYFKVMHMRWVLFA